jgi:hypothetical protein
LNKKAGTLWHLTNTGCIWLYAPGFKKTPLVELGVSNPLPPACKALLRKGGGRLPPFLNIILVFNYFSSQYYILIVKLLIPGIVPISGAEVSTGRTNKDFYLIFSLGV